MSGFREVRKYLIYAFIAGWMFFLGVLTGRGTIPVHFDTKDFSDRLATIAQSLSKGKKSDEKLDLDFYHGLVNDSVIIEPKEPEAETPTNTDKASEPKSQNRQKTDIKQTKGSYTLQVAAYQNYKDAAAEVIELEKMGFSSYQVKTKYGGKVWYRVRIGSFLSLKHAKTAKTLLNKAGIDSIIFKKEQNENMR
jgi:cell division protein FtsN